MEEILTRGEILNFIPWDKKPGQRASLRSVYTWGSFGDTAQAAQRGGSPIPRNIHGLDEALSDQIQLKMSLLMARVWTRRPLDVPPNPFSDSTCMVPLRSSSSTVPCLPSLLTPQWSTGRMLTPGISLLGVTQIRKAAFFFFWSSAELKESVSHKPLAAQHKGSCDYCNPFSILTLYNPRGCNCRPLWAGITPISSWYQNKNILELVPFQMRDRRHLLTQERKKQILGNIRKKNGNWDSPRALLLCPTPCPKPLDRA